MSHAHAAHGHDHAEPAEEQFTQEFWDARYASRPQIWSGNPNPHLVSQAGALPPSAALDVGSGEGADAIWLAREGWQVTAVDVSAVALERAANHARAADPDAAFAHRIAWQRVDAQDWTPDPAAYDLVSAQFMYLPPEERTALFGRLAAAVAPGGTLLIVGHHPQDLPSEQRGGARERLMYTAEEVVAVLDGEEWIVELADVVPRERKDPQGHVRTIHDARMRAVRRR